MQNNTVGILLAGGLSSRYGSPKAFLELGGKKFFEHAYHALMSVCDDVVIVTRPQFKSLFPLKYKTITDIPAFDECGPLAGIYTGIRSEIADNYVVLPCDMPLINGRMLQTLYKEHQHHQLTIVEVDGRLQPLISIWHASCLLHIKKALDNKQFAIKNMFDMVKVNIISSRNLSEDMERFSNINTSEHYKEMTEWLRS